jgi:hypothetical protein
MSSASTKRISNDTGLPDTLDALLCRYDVLVNAVETMSGELASAAHLLIQLNASWSKMAAVALSVDPLDARGTAQELSARTVIQAREVELMTTRSSDLLELAGTIRKSVDVRGI